MRHYSYIHSNSTCSYCWRIKRSLQAETRPGEDLLLHDKKSDPAFAAVINDVRVV